MNSELTSLIKWLNDDHISETAIINWGCPIISFGNLKASRIATLGINPSNREFVDKKGKELSGKNQRFHTLKSLGLTNWSQVEDSHVSEIINVCENYFYSNPYDTWFKKLEYIISGTSQSYYVPGDEACHLDLIPFATECKWTELSTHDRSTLMKIGVNTLGLVLKKSSIELLILNGKSVVDNFERLTDVKFRKRRMSTWTLPRRLNGGVIGYSYTADVKKIGGVQLKHEVRVLGYNHNIQSSFGMTSKVQKAIRNWISRQASKVL